MFTFYHVSVVVVFAFVIVIVVIAVVVVYFVSIGYVVVDDYDFVFYKSSWRLQ